MAWFSFYKQLPIDIPHKRKAVQILIAVLHPCMARIPANTDRMRPISVNKRIKIIE